MSYIDKIHESNLKVHNHSVAQRILNLIGELRLNSKENDSRRWIWELMQNAKDVAFENQPVSVDINFQTEVKEPFIEFKHNGKPFTIDNISFLIEQVSTKDREIIDGKKPKTTGKFGTGFLTTHLLSEKVELESVVKEPELQFKKFELFLDRSGRDMDEIIDSVRNSFNLLSSLDENEAFENFNQRNFNTVFRYLLDTDGINVAKKGLEDLEITLPFTLAFVPSIQTVTINSKTTYKLLPERIYLTEGIEIFTIQKESEGDLEEYNIAIISNNRITLAIRIDYQIDKISFIPLVKNLPKLFCDFPLIGSEDFNFPMVINSSYFNPKIERDGIYLSDKSDHSIVENKILMIEAKDLFLKFLEFTALNNWLKMYVLADISLPKSKEWISNVWMKEFIVEPIRNKLLTIRLVDTIAFDRIPISCGGFNSFLHPDAIVDFPYHKDSDILQKLYKLCDNQYFLIPIETDYQYWAEIIWDKKYEVNLMSFVKLIESKQNISILSEKLGKDELEIINWLNEFYLLLLEEGTLIKDISQNKIYPNQNGVFRQKDELLKEVEEIPEILKDIVKELGEDFRERLIDNKIIAVLPKNNICNAVALANQIIKLIRPRFSEIPRSEETRKIFKKLYLWFNQYGKEAENLFDDLYKNKHKLLDDKEIVSSLKKAETYDILLTAEPNLSLERIQELIEIEELSKGFFIDKNYTPDELQKRINFENGWKGEAFVYKLLKLQGLNVSWPNKSTTETPNKIIDFEDEVHFINDKGDKYDMVISLPENKKSFIQVKSTSTDISRADEIAMPISVREWKFINEKLENDSYYLARVFNVNSRTEVYFMKIENTI